MLSPVNNWWFYSPPQLAEKAQVQVCAANEAGQSPWSKLEVGYVTQSVRSFGLPPSIFHRFIIFYNEFISFLIVVVHERRDAMSFPGTFRFLCRSTLQPAGLTPSRAQPVSIIIQCDAVAKIRHWISLDTHFISFHHHDTVYEIKCNVIA